MAKKLTLGPEKWLQVKYFTEYLSQIEPSAVLLMIFCSTNAICEYDIDGTIKGGIRE